MIGSYGRLTDNISNILRSEILGSSLHRSDPGSDPGSDTGADPGDWPDWSQDWPLRISKLRYTGLEALLLASNNLSLRRPEIGYARLVVPRNVPNYSTIPDS